MSFSTSSEFMNNKNKNVVFSNDSSSNNDSSISSNIFNKEFNRIMKFNKKIIANEKNNRNKNNILDSLTQNFNNNKIYNKRGMKKSLSQANFNNKRSDRTDNEKTTYSKNKTRSNKFCSTIDNQKSICYINSNKSKNISENKKLDDNININTHKFR